MSSAPNPAPPASTPQLTAVAPALAVTESTDDIMIFGQLTSFAQGDATADFGPDITVNSTTVLSSTVLSANITVGATANVGPRDITVTTGGQALVLSARFTVLSGAPDTVNPRPPKVVTRKMYNVAMYLAAIGTDQNQNIMNILWDITGQLWLVPDPTNAVPTPSSWIPQFQPGNSLGVSVDHWILQGSDGTQCVLTSSMTYDVTVGTPTLDLTIPSPILGIPFVQPLPSETIEVKGYSSQISMFSGMLMTVVGTNAITLPQVEALTGNTGTPASAVPSNPPSITQAAQQLQSHLGDTAWLMSPEGQLAIADLQQQAMATVSIPASQAGDPAQMAATFQTIQVPWNPNSGVPVNKALEFIKDELTIRLHVAVYRNQGD